MADIMAYCALLAVIALLAVSIWRQFTLLGPRAQIADSLGITPQWKFFALSTIETRDDSFDDFHLLARLADGDGEVGPWQSIFWNEERKWFHFLWNPYLRARGEIQIQMINIVGCGDTAKEESYQSSLAYLTVLRYCLDSLSLQKASAIQLAIAVTRGNEARRASAKFLSAWHSL